MNVWPHGAPGEETSSPGTISPDNSGGVQRLTDVTSPELHLYGMEKGASRPAVMVCPGGGYSILAADLEGTEVARWLNSLGFAAAVLHYRVPDRREGAFQDAQRALSLLRERAGEFGIDPDRIGVLGFSAGAHLSARLAAGYGQRSYPAIDQTDLVSCRPDFALLIYPAYLINKVTGQPSDDVRPHPAMPPVFLMQTEDDPHFCVLPYAAALEAAGVKTHALTYPVGGHGYGLRAGPEDPVYAWPAAAAAWIRQQVGGDH